MSYRLSSPDTEADVTLRDLLDRERLPAFTVTAGAGSGKTTSLVKALSHVAQSRGAMLRARTQRVACITYTDGAAQEIFADIGSSPLAHVSTIHSFLWSLAKPFQRDIGQWVQSSLEEEIASLEKAIAEPGRSTAQTRAKRVTDLERRRHQLESAKPQSHWSYGMGADYSNGVLGHSDILNMVPDLIVRHPLLTKLVARQYPFVFVDESQDTLPVVVDCLKKVWRAADGQMCLGFFGDPMQQIYLQGAGAIAGEPGWASVRKPENYRSSRRVLACINAVRAESDDLRQISGQAGQEEGEAHCFVLPADDARSQQLDAVRIWLDENSHVGRWSPPSEAGGAKVLLLVHRMAAHRLSFSSLFSAFNDNRATSLSDAFDDGTAWPLLPFRDVIVPLCATRSANDPVVLRVTTQHSPRLREARAGAEVKAALSSLRTSVEGLRAMVAPGENPTLEAVLRFATERGLLDLDPRLAAHLDIEGASEDIILDSRSQNVLTAMMQCPYADLQGYQTYVDKVSPYSTQHGSKGAEFDRVVVVLDDEEGGWHQYSYDKLLGIRDLSAKDRENQAAGLDSAIERTRRLFYVCVSRARRGLALVLFTSDVAKAAVAVKKSSIGEHVNIITDLR